MGLIIAVGLGRRWPVVRTDLAPSDDFIATAASIALFAFLEESAWRGYLLPSLLGRARYPVVVGVAGLIWFAWHLPYLDQLERRTRRASRSRLWRRVCSSACSHCSSSHRAVLTLPIRVARVRLARDNEPCGAARASGWAQADRPAGTAALTERGRHARHRHCRRSCTMDVPPSRSPLRPLRVRVWRVKIVGRPAHPFSPTTRPFRGLRHRGHHRFPCGHGWSHCDLLLAQGTCLALATHKALEPGQRQVGPYPYSAHS